MATPKPKTFEDYLKEEEESIKLLSPGPPKPYRPERAEFLEEEMEKLDRPVQEDAPPPPIGTRRGTEPIIPGTVPLPLAKWDPLTMTERSVPLYSDASKKTLRDQESSYRLVHEVMTRDLVAGTAEAEALEEVSPERLEEQMLNDDQGALHWGFSTFQLPESIVWSRAAYLASYLPDPDTYAGELASDVFSFGWRHAISMASPSTQKAMTAVNLMGDPAAYFGVDIASMEQKSEYAQRQADQGKKMYSALSIGKVYEEGAWGSTYDETTMVGDALTPFGFDTGIEVPMARGKDIIDTMISKEDARELAAAAKKAGNHVDAAVWQTLTTDAGREWWGLAAELTMDPLWFLGLAKGAKVITVGGEALTIGPDVVKAVDAVVEVGKTLPESQRMVVGALRGSPDDMQKMSEAAAVYESRQAQFAEKMSETQKALDNPALAQQMAKDDILQSIENLDRSAARRAKVADVTPDMIARHGTEEKALSALKARNARNVMEARAIRETVEIQKGKLAGMTDAAAAEKYLNNIMRQDLAAVGYHKRKAAQINRLLEAGYDGEKVLSTAGAVRFHVPFTSKTYNPIQRTFKMNAVAGDTLASISARTGINGSDLARLNKMTEAQLAAKIQNGERIVVGLGGGGMKGLVPGFILARGDKLVDPLRAPNIRDIKLKMEVSPNTVTKGEKLAYLLSEYGGIGKTSQWIMDNLATLVGTRWWAPRIAKRQMDVGMQYFRGRGVDDAVIKNMLGHGDKAMIRLMKTAPDIWESYQSALARRLTDINVSRDKLVGILERMNVKAKDIAAARLARGGSYAGTTGQTVMDEAVGYLEKGMLHRFPPELNELFDEVVELQKATAEALGKSEEEMRQALQNMIRFFAGDVEKYREVTEEASRVKEEMADIAVEAITKAEKELVRVRGGRRVAEKLSQQDYAKIKDIRAERARLNKEIAEVKGRKKGGKDPRWWKRKERERLGRQLKAAESKRAESGLEKIISDIKGQEQAIESSIKSFRSKVADLKTGPVEGKQPYIRELNASLDSLRTKREELEDLLKKQEEERPRIKVEEKRAAGYERGFQEWEMEYWDRYQDIVTAWKREGFTDEHMMMAVMKTMTGEAKTVKDLAKRFTGTEFLGEPLKKPRPITAADTGVVADLELEKKMLANERRRLKPEAGRGKAIDNRVEQIDRQLDKIRVKEDVGVVEGVAERAIYPTVMTERFVKVEEDIAPLVEDFEELFEGYKKRYLQQGMQFVKDPMEIMKDFGVADYVPHLRYEPGRDISRYVNTGDARAESLITGNTDQYLTEHLSMNASKLRTLQGTIDEINTMAKSGEKGGKPINWSFTMHPGLLHARMMNSSRGLASHEMFLTFLRTGVIRGFDDAESARRAGFVPVMDRNSRGLQMQMLMDGNLVKADGTMVPAAEVEEMLLLLIAGDDRVQPLVNWARDIAEFGNMVNVEKAMGVINALQLEALARPGNKWLGQFLVDGERLDIAERFAAIRNARHSEHLKGLKSKRDKLAAKPRPTDKQRAEIDRLDELLDSSSPAHEVILRRISNRSWKEVEKEVNKIISDVNNASRSIPEREVYGRLLEAVRDENLPTLSSRNLMMYFDTEGLAVTKMYVPEQVQESLRMLTARTAVRDDKRIFLIGYGTLWNIARVTNNWWKTLVTVMAPMFHSRNEMGNIISNMLDVGVGGVFNLDTNMKSYHLSWLMDLHSRYGSLGKARTALAAPRKVGEGAKDFSYRKISHSALTKFSPDMDKGIDLGDGLIRTWDEAIELMVDKGVMSGNSNYRLDIDRASDFFMERAHGLSMAEKEAKIGRKIKKGWSKVEDYGAVTMSMLASGGLPLAMSKGWGTALATRLENRSRAVNFIANMKRGRSVDESAAHVAKFLFDYNDLTPRQKDYMRILMPFFTWNQKNFLLQLDMMRENPIFFANFDRLFYGTLPMVAAHIEQEQARMSLPPDARGPDTPVKYNTMVHRTLERVQYYPEYKMYRVRVPGSLIGMPSGYELEGFGLPQESFAEYVHKLQSVGTVRPGEAAIEGRLEAVLASTHWVARALYSVSLRRDPFYKESLDELKMREANNIANALHTLERLGPMFEPMREYISGVFGVVPLGDPRKKDGEPLIEGGAIYYFGRTEFSEMGLALKYAPNPFERAMREGAMVQDAFYRSLMTKEAKMDKDVVAERLPYYMRVLNATIGIKIKQQASTDYLRSMNEQDMKNVMFDQTDGLGLTENGKVKK